MNKSRQVNSVLQTNRARTALATALLAKIAEIAREGLLCSFVDSLARVHSQTEIVMPSSLLRDAAATRVFHSFRLHFQTKTSYSRHDRSLPMKTS